MSVAKDRDALHRLVNTLREEDVAIAARMLEAVTASDPLLSTIANAPLDDERETEAERAATERAKRDLERGSTVTKDEIKRKLQR